MRLITDKERGGWLVRLMTDRWAESAYLATGITGLCLEVSLPTTWHDSQRGWLQIGLGLFRVGISFPWHKSYPDHMQCCGPTFGFVFFGDGLHLHWGQDKGTRDDPSTIIAMPWQWRHRTHQILSPKYEYPYKYHLKDGSTQNRIATVFIEERTWTRPWLPHKLVSRSLDVSFDHGVGERTRSWKGGVMGCSWAMEVGEGAMGALLRMERERKFE